MGYWSFGRQGHYTEIAGWRKGLGESLVGGKGDFKLDSNFDRKQLDLGIKHEMEHTTNPLVAKEIAKDHLTEDANYYSHLNAMERKVKVSKKFNAGSVLRRIEAGEDISLTPEQKKGVEAYQQRMLESKRFKRKERQDYARMVKEGKAW
jgi:hypothetical protein